MPPHTTPDEERPLLSADHGSDIGSHYRIEDRSVDFGSDDPENPRAWSPRTKLTNVAIIAFMSILSPLASSMFTPGISQIAEDLHASEQAVIATTTGFVIMLGLGPLILAPLSEALGRRQVYIWAFSVFTLLQIPTALSPNVGFLIACRTISGLFGSVGIANGGGSLNDMYLPSQRAGIFGWYLLGPLLGPTLGPLFGGTIVTRLGWRWIYWVLAIICVVPTTVGFFFLRETYVPVLLARRKRRLLEEANHATSTTTSNGDTDGDTAPLLEANGDDHPHRKLNLHYTGEDPRPLHHKLLTSMKRPLTIFIQPIVFTMSFYQGIIFATTYSIYTNMQPIFSSEPYNFNSEQIGLLYLGPGLGFLTSVWFLVPRIDSVYNHLTAKNNGIAQPEFRLPLVNLGSIVIPLGLFGFAWSVQYHLHFLLCLAFTFIYGIGQVLILNTTQNYYIDSFDKYAASAIAGGSVFRSVMGGVVPLFSPMLFDKVGYGWGISVFGFAALLVAPAPVVFYVYGERVRDRFKIKF